MRYLISRTFFGHVIMFLGMTGLYVSAVAAACPAQSEPPAIPGVTREVVLPVEVIQTKTYPVRETIRVARKSVDFRRSHSTFLRMANNEKLKSSGPHRITRGRQPTMAVSMSNIHVVPPVSGVDPILVRFSTTDIRSTPIS